MSTDLKLNRGAKQAELTLERGGRGSSSACARAELPTTAPQPHQPQAPPSRQAASMPASATQPAITSSMQPNSPYKPLELLPVGKPQQAASLRLQALKAAYEELHHTEQAIKWIGRYLPKLALNQELAANKQRLLTTIRQLASGAAVCQPSSAKSPASK